MINIISRRCTVRCTRGGAETCKRSGRFVPDQSRLGRSHTHRGGTPPWPPHASSPAGLHHTAYTTKDMEKTRVFYEEVIGLPLVTTWSESDELFGQVRTYCHCFFGLADGGALAFFQFADKSDEQTFSPLSRRRPFITSRSRSIHGPKRRSSSASRQRAIRRPTLLCWSTAIAVRSISKTPTGCSSNSHAMRPTPSRSPRSARRMRATLQRWLRGDHTSNNLYR